MLPRVLEMLHSRRDDSSRSQLEASSTRPVVPFLISISKIRSLQWLSRHGTCPPPAPRRRRTAPPRASAFPSNVKPAISSRIDRSHRFLQRREWPCSFRGWNPRHRSLLCAGYGIVVVRREVGGGERERDQRCLWRVLAGWLPREEKGSGHFIARR